MMYCMGRMQARDGKEQLDQMVLAEKSRLLCKLEILDSVQSRCVEVSG